LVVVPLGFALKSNVRFGRTTSRAFAAVVLELCRSDLVKGNKSESLCLNSEMKSVLQVLTFALAQSRFRVAAAKPK